MKTQIKKTAAVVTIHRAGHMTRRGRQQIAEWLRYHADLLVRHGHEYSEQFRGHYLYR